MKWIAGLILAATVAGCQEQQKQPPAASQSARATLPGVLDVTAPPASGASTPPAQPAAAPAPAVSETPAVASAPGTPEGASYTVKRGDTLFHIAKEHYGDGKKWQQIAQANPGVSPTSLKVGQTLVMPQ